MSALTASISPQNIISNTLRAYVENWIIYDSSFGRSLPKYYNSDRVIVRKITDVILAVIMPAINGQLNISAFGEALQNTLKNAINELTIKEIIYDISAVNIEVYIAKKFNRTHEVSKRLFYTDRALILIAVKTALPLIVNSIAPGWNV